MNELDFRIELAISKGRNIIYYRERDTRERCQYIHVVREYRKTLLSLLKILPQEYEKVRSLFEGIVNVIDPKIKSEGCIQTILEMKKVFTANGINIE